MRMMAMVLGLALVTLGFQGCSTYSTEPSESDNNMSTEIRIVNVESFNSNVIIEHPVDIEFLDELSQPMKTDKDVMEYAQKVIDNFHREGKFMDFSLVNIVYSIKDEAYHFEYSLDEFNSENDILIDHSVLYVEINLKSSEQNKAWIEE